MFRRNITSASFALLALTLLAIPSRAETVLDGDRDALQIVTHDASIEEVFSALGEKFGLRYRPGTPLARRLNGRYSGSLRRCIGQILSGYDFIIKTNAERMEVIVLGGATPNTTAASPGVVVAHARRRED
jgi:hypothetical protein